MRNFLGQSPKIPLLGGGPNLNVANWTAPRRVVDPRVSSEASSLIGIPITSDDGDDDPPGPGSR